MQSHEGNSHKRNMQNTYLQLSDKDTWSASPAGATALILAAEDLILMSKHSTAPSSPPQAISP